METTVYVTLTGGCPFEDNFEVKKNLIWLFKSFAVDISATYWVTRYTFKGPEAALVVEETSEFFSAQFELPRKIYSSQAYFVYGSGRERERENTD